MKNEVTLVKTYFKKEVNDFIIIQENKESGNSEIKFVKLNFNSNWTIKDNVIYDEDGNKLISLYNEKTTKKFLSFIKSKQQNNINKIILLSILFIGLFISILLFKNFSNVNILPETKPKPEFSIVDELMKNNKNEQEFIDSFKKELDLSK